MTNDSTDQLSFSDVINSLTGYEEDAIEERFGRPISDFVQGDETGQATRILPKAYRALLFVVARRAGEAETDAYKAAMSLPFKDVSARFWGDEEDADEPEAETPLADGGAPSA